MKKMFDLRVALCWILVVSSSGLSALFGEEVVPWQVSGAPYRLVLRFPQTAGPLWNEPLILTGETLYRLTGVAQVRAASIIVIGPDGKPVASQVDERSTNGEFVLAGDGRFEHRDELVFPVDIQGNHAVVYQIYFDNRPASPPVPHQPGVGQAAGLTMDNGRFRFDLRGPGVDPYEQGRPENYARGALPWFQFDGIDLTSIHDNWGFFLFGHPYGCGPGRTPWSAPRLVINGPVRQIAETSWADPSASVTHYCCLYKGSPTLDLIEVARIVQSAPSRQDVYSFPFMVGGFTDANDILYVPLTGNIRSRGVRDFPRQGWVTFYDAVFPDEGWIAWFDVNKKHGLALFFESQAVLDARKRWVSYRPVQNTTIRVKSNLAEVWSRGFQRNPGVENTVTFANRSFVPPETMERSFRLCGFRSGGGEGVQRRYRLWGVAPERVADIALPEKKAGL